MKVNLAKLTRNISKWGIKHTPEILHAIGFAAGASAVVLTGVGTVKAVRAYDEQQPATKKETVRVCGKYYIPAGGAMLLSFGCHCMAMRAYIKRNAMLSSWGMMAYDKLARLEEKNVEILGERKATQINDEIAKESVTKFDPLTVVSTGHGDTLFYDQFLNVSYRSDWGFQCSVINDFNQGIAYAMAYERGERDKPPGHYPSIFDYEKAMGLPETTFCNHWGWYDGSYIRTTVTYETASNGEPIGIITHHTMPMPRPEYMHVHR